MAILNKFLIPFFKALKNIKEKSKLIHFLIKQTETII